MVGMTAKDFLNPKKTPVLFSKSIWPESGHNFKPVLDTMALNRNRTEARNECLMANAGLADNLVV